MTVEEESAARTWQVRYSDHSGNRYRFWSSGEPAVAHYSYDPVTPELSSSGSYSGGEPQQGTLDTAQAATLLQAVRDLESAVGAHTQVRAKGAGSFAIATDDDAERRFLIRGGARLRQFDQLVAPYRESS